MCMPMTRASLQNIPFKISHAAAKETINKTKRQPTVQEKIFANNATDMGLISEIYKQLMSLDIKKRTTQSKNGQKT